MIPDAHVWLIWSSAFLVPWVALYLAYPRHRRVMVRASLLTMPFGLTEPLFVPEYWNPPSLFGLAQRTGFDVESLIFCFAIGGRSGRGAGQRADPAGGSPAGSAGAAPLGAGSAIGKLHEACHPLTQGE